jgi:hypothetical protein
MNLDESINRIKIELQVLRRERWEREKEFYEQREVLHCEISLLQSRIQKVLAGSKSPLSVYEEVLNTHTISSPKEEEQEPYVTLHRGHEVLLMASLHQLNARNNILQMTARHGKAMVEFLERAKNQLEEENALLELEQVNQLDKQHHFVVDQRLAITVVAQRLVIRKIKNLLGEAVEDIPFTSPIGTVLVITDHIFPNEADYESQPFDLSSSCLSLEDPSTCQSLLSCNSTTICNNGAKLNYDPSPQTRPRFQDRKLIEPQHQQAQHPNSVPRYRNHSFQQESELSSSSFPSTRKDTAAPKRQSWGMALFGRPVISA